VALPVNAQWLRYAQVIVGKGGNGLSIDSLKVNFTINKNLHPSPNSAIIKIYNLNPSNQTLIQREYTDIILNAGYKDNAQVIFRGNIKHVFKYRDKTDFVTEIQAADGDDDFRNAQLNVTLAAGTSRKHIIEAAVGSFNGTIEGYSDVEDFVHIRGMVLSGNTRDILNDLAKDSGANWSIQDGQLQIVKANSTLPNTAIAINSETGMLDVPEISDKGIEVKCLMNPSIKINSKIQLDNNDIRIRDKKAPLTSAKNAEITKAQSNLVRLDPDGIYKVIRLQHRGGNRENEWVTDLVCIGLNQPIPADQTTLSDFGGMGGIV
jgi:hypothetical protein